MLNKRYDKSFKRYIMSLKRDHIVEAIHFEHPS